MSAEILAVLRKILMPPAVELQPVVVAFPPATAVAVVTLNTPHLGALGPQGSFDPIEDQGPPTLSEREADEMIDVSPADKPLYPTGGMPALWEPLDYLGLAWNLTMPRDKRGYARVKRVHRRSLLIIRLAQPASSWRPRDWLFVTARLERIV